LARIFLEVFPDLFCDQEGLGLIAAMKNSEVAERITIAQVQAFVEGRIQQIVRSLHVV
jgi:hypothetical protein